MNILFIDPLSPVGHKGFNNSFIRLLKKMGKVSFICKNNYLNNLEINYLNNIPDKFYRFDTKLNRIKSNLKIHKWIFKNVKMNEYDLVLFSSFDTIAFSIASKKYQYNNIAIINHKNVDELDSFIKKLFYKRINNKVKQIYLDSFIEEYIEKNVHIKNKKYSINHPLKDITLKNFNNDINKSNSPFIIFSPGEGNDEIFVQKLIERQKRTNFLGLYNVKIIMRSKNISYVDNNLEIFSRYLSSDEYNEYFQKSSCILIFYKDIFKYRMSGILLESISYQKKVICSPNLLFETFNKKYKNFSYTIRNMEDLEKLLSRKEIIINENIDWNNIYREYSDNYIIEQLKLIYN